MTPIKRWLLVHPIIILMSTLCFASLNIRGVSKCQKFERLMCLTEKCDVLCLQETKWGENVSNEIFL